ncbi:hypothetical protein BDZ45DRAFT_805968 [Acephala macrosclerotiorum]|nr:hypothetical protein BDZ45DRAFT_805968 [Acephala macrosclerotiorum]
MTVNRDIYNLIMNHHPARGQNSTRRSRKVLKTIRRKIRLLLRKLLPTWHARSVENFIQEMPFNPDPSLFDSPLVEDEQVNYALDQEQETLNSFDRIRNKIGSLPQALLGDLNPRQVARRIEWYTKNLYAIERDYVYASYNGEVTSLARRLEMLEEDLDVDIEAVRKWQARREVQDVMLSPPVYTEGVRPPGYCENARDEEDPPPYLEGLVED